MTARELPELPRPVAWRVCWKRPGESAVCNLFDREPESRPGIDHCIEVTPLYTSPRVSEGMVAILDTLLLNWKSRADRLGNSFGPGDMIISAALQDCIRELEAALAQRGKE